MEFEGWAGLPLAHSMSSSIVSICDKGPQNAKPHIFKISIRTVLWSREKCLDALILI